MDFYLNDEFYGTDFSLSIKGKGKGKCKGSKESNNFNKKKGGKRQSKTDVQKNNNKTPYNKKHIRSVTSKIEK